MIKPSIGSKIIWSSSLYKLYLARGKIEDIKLTPPDPWPGDPILGESIFQGNYNLAGQTVHFSNLPVWFPPNMNEEWITDLHSFSWLRHLRAKSGSLARKHARGIISNWINNNGSWNDFSWRADILSRRVSAWLSNAGFLFAEKDEKFYMKFKKITIIFYQIIFLQKKWCVDRSTTNK